MAYYAVPLSDDLGICTVVDMAGKSHKVAAGTGYNSAGIAGYAGILCT